MARRSAGEGSIVQRKDGRHCAALQISSKRAWVYGKTRSEVVEKLRVLTEQGRTTGRLPAAGSLTVEAYLTTWLAQAATRIRPTTLYDYRVMVTNHLVPAIGSTKLARLTPFMVSHLYGSLRAKLS